MTGMDGQLVRLARLTEPALPLEEVAEVSCRRRRVLGVTGVGRVPVGRLGAGPVAVLAEQEAEAVRRRRGVLGCLESIAC